MAITEQEVKLRRKKVEHIVLISGQYLTGSLAWKDYKNTLDFINEGIQKRH